MRNVSHRSPRPSVASAGSAFGAYACRKPARPSSRLARPAEPLARHARGHQPVHRRRTRYGRGLFHAPSARNCIEPAARPAAEPQGVLHPRRIQTEDPARRRRGAEHTAGRGRVEPSPVVLGRIEREASAGSAPRTLATTRRDDRRAVRPDHLRGGQRGRDDGGARVDRAAGVGCRRSRANGRGCR